VLEGTRYAPGKWDEIGMHCSMTERRADEATRDVNNWLKCYYMRDRIGEEFAGTIAAVVPFGVFVALDSVYVEGLVHVSELGEDYFQYDNTKHQMLGERSGQRYRLGDRLQVKLVRADLETGRIDFVLATAPVAMQVAAPRLEETPFSKPRGKAQKPPSETQGKLRKPLSEPCKPQDEPKSKAQSKPQVKGRSEPSSQPDEAHAGRASLLKKPRH